MPLASELTRLQRPPSDLEGWKYDLQRFQLVGALSCARRGGLYRGVVLLLKCPILSAAV